MPMSRRTFDLVRLARRALMALALVVTIAGFSAVATALDRVVLRNGSVIEGTIFDSEADFVRIRLADGTVRFLSRSNIRSIEKDVPATAPAKPADEVAPASKPAPKAGQPERDATEPGALSGASRAVILPFGPPSSWQGQVGSTVGIHITADAWRDVLDELIDDRVDIVVVRINSGGGRLSEVARFHELFRDEYIPRFRTVAWVESAISAAAMSPWILREFYFMPEGNMGACTAFYGQLNALQGDGLQEVLYLMENVSREAGRSPLIMRSMQVTEPLSCNVSSDNVVSWFADQSGKYLVNPPGRILTLNARDAVKFRIALGVASTPRELASSMGLNEVNWVGQRAVDRLEHSMRRAHAALEDWPIERARFDLAINAARQMSAQEQLRDRLLREVGVARRSLREIERLTRFVPSLLEELPPGWIDDRKREIRELLMQR
ncbi:MAG: hypothetical protein AB7K52_00495 [Phycisphaerales bacterium]